MAILKREWNGIRPTRESSRKGALVAWASNEPAMRAGAAAGGKTVGNQIHQCPNCGREIKGNSGFGMHKKKCTAQPDK